MILNLAHLYYRHLLGPTSLLPPTLAQITNFVSLPPKSKGVIPSLLSEITNSKCVSLSMSYFVNVTLPQREVFYKANLRRVCLLLN